MLDMDQIYNDFRGQYNQRYIGKSLDQWDQRWQKSDLGRLHQLGQIRDAFANPQVMQSIDDYAKQLYASSDAQIGQAQDQARGQTKAGAARRGMLGSSGHAQAQAAVQAGAQGQREAAARTAEQARQGQVDALEAQQAALLSQVLAEDPFTQQGFQASLAGYQDATAGEGAMRSLEDSYRMLLSNQLGDFAANGLGEYIATGYRAADNRNARASTDWLNQYAQYLQGGSQGAAPAQPQSYSWYDRR